MSCVDVFKHFEKLELAGEFDAVVLQSRKDELMRIAEFACFDFLIAIGAIEEKIASGVDTLIAVEDILVRMVRRHALDDYNPLTFFLASNDLRFKLSLYLPDCSEYQHDITVCADIFLTLGVLAYEDSQGHEGTPAYRAHCLRDAVRTKREKERI